MELLISLGLIVIGIVGVIWGADKFTDGASAMARRMNVPQIVIGLTVVAFGTSMPEFFVSFVSALKHSSGLAIGNIVGSNIFNAMFIVGAAAMVAPILITKSNIKKDIPWAIGTSVLLILLCLDGNISRWDGLILLIAFTGFMIYTLRLAKKGHAEEEEVKREYTKWQTIGLILLGLVCLVVASDLFVRGSKELALMLGVDEAVIGLTIVACGTSLPELATSVVAAHKGQSALSIGNVVGSNIFNVLFILGLTGLISPMPTKGITWIDLSMLFVSIALLWIVSRTRYKVSYKEGIVLIVVFLAYIGWLIYSA